MPGMEGEATPGRLCLPLSCRAEEEKHDPLLLGNSSEGGLGDAWIRDAVGGQSRASAWGDLRPLDTTQSLGHPLSGAEFNATSHLVIVAGGFQGSLVP